MNRSSFTKILGVTIVVLDSLSPLFVIAYNPPPDLTPIPTPFSTIAGLTGFLDTIANFIFGIFMAVAVIAILIAAYHYLTSGGDASRVLQTQQMLLYAAVAIVVALLAKALPLVLADLVGGSSGGGGAPGNPYYGPPSNHLPGQPY